MLVPIVVIRRGVVVLVQKVLLVQPADPVDKDQVRLAILPLLVSSVQNLALTTTRVSISQCHCLQDHLLSSKPL